MSNHRPPLVLCYLLAIGACGSHKSSPAAQGPSAGPGDASQPTGQVRTVGDDTEQAVEAGKETLLAVALNQCGNGQTIAVTLALAADPSQAAPLEFQLTPAACAREVQIDVPALDAGAYDLTVNVGAVGGEAHRVRLNAAKADTGPTVTTPTATETWVGEPSADVNCGGKSCDEQVALFIGTPLGLYEGLTSAHAVGRISLTPAAGEGPQGRFSIERDAFSPDGFSPAVAAGEYAVRKGHLALRSDDKKRAFYAHWYGVDDNGGSSAVLQITLPLADGTTRAFLLK